MNKLKARDLLELSREPTSFKSETEKIFKKINKKNGIS